MLNIIIIILLLILLLWMVFWEGSMVWAGLIGPPIVYSSYSGIRDSFKLAKLKKGETVIDLGCGNGRSLLLAAREFGAKGIGIDRSLYCVLVARFKIHLAGQSKNIQIFRKPFEKAEDEIKRADVVYLYLWPSALDKIAPWLFDSISEKTRVVSLAFVFSKHKPVAEVETMNLRMKMKVRLYRK